MAAEGADAWYRLFGWKDYIAGRMADNFADYGVEDIQISDYLVEAWRSRAPTTCVRFSSKDDLEELDGFGHQLMRMASRNHDRITEPNSRSLDASTKRNSPERTRAVELVIVGEEFAWTRASAA